MSFATLFNLLCLPSSDTVTVIMARPKKDITLRDVVNHMDHRFNALEKRLDKRVGGVEKRLTKLEAAVKEGFRKTNYAFERLYENRGKDLKRVQKTEDRLDHIENEELPAVKSHIGFAP